MNKRTVNAPRFAPIVASGAIGIALMLSASSATAHGGVHWSVGVGIGGPPVVYQQAPPVVYASPQFGYRQPPVYYQPAPVIVGRDPYYRHREHEWRERAWREHEWRERREHEWREHEWREQQWHERHEGYGWNGRRDRD